MLSFQWCLARCSPGSDIALVLQNVVVFSIFFRLFGLVFVFGFLFGFFCFFGFFNKNMF